MSAAYPEMAQACFAFFIELMQAAQFSLLGGAFFPGCNHHLAQEPCIHGNPREQAQAFTAQMMPNTQMMQLQVLQQHEVPKICLTTNTSPKNIPMVSSTAEAVRYPTHIAFFFVIMSCYLGKTKDWNCLRFWVNPWLNPFNCSFTAVCPS